MAKNKDLNTNSFGAGVYLRQNKPVGKGDNSFDDHEDNNFYINSNRDLSQVSGLEVGLKVFLER